MPTTDTGDIATRILNVLGIPTTQAKLLKALLTPTESNPIDADGDGIPEEIGAPIFDTNSHDGYRLFPDGAEDGLGNVGDGKWYRKTPTPPYENIWDDPADAATQQRLNDWRDKAREYNNRWFDFKENNKPIIDPAAQSAKDAASQWQPRHDPLTLDLDGDGLETTGIAATNPILFDHDGDGIKNGTGWVSSDDGFLVRDVNGNGTIDSGRELFGDNTIKSNGQLATDGFDALVDLDSISNGGNADGMISNADAQFASLRVWRDLNQDGISQSNELFTLSSQNIASINVTKTANSQTLANGSGRVAVQQRGTHRRTPCGCNQIADLGSFTRTDGSTGTAGAVTGNLADINLASDTFHRTFPNVLDTTSAATLPDMQGSGKVRDLREAATQSTTLQSLLTQFSAATTRAGQMALIDQLLDAWADTGGMAESLDDRAAAATYTLTNGVTVPYVVIYDRFGTVVRSFEVVGGQTSGGTGGGGGGSGGSFTGRDVDNPTLTQAFRDTIAAWTQKLHIIESFNGSYFFGLPSSTQTAGAVTGMTSSSPNTSSGSSSTIVAVPITIRYEQAQLDLLQQSYDAIRSSVYDALSLQTRLKPMLDQINLVIDANGINLDFSQVNAMFETKIGQKAANDNEWRVVA